MLDCPVCSNQLIQKEGVKKLCAQIGNPDIAIVEATDPMFCDGCNEYYLSTDEIAAAIIQVKESLGQDRKEISTGIYS